jgi:Fe-S protein assembly chaperone HscA
MDPQGSNQVTSGAGSSAFHGPGTIVGIDLGTTNSLVAAVLGGEPKVLRDASGDGIVPSVVTVADGEVLVGRKARQRKVVDAAQTAFSVKRLLGRSGEELREAARALPYEVLPGEGVARVRLGDRTLSAIEISALILKELKSRAEEALGEPVSRAVITVPAYFNDSQRQATRTAGRLAGLDVLRIINEPTAAALAYGIGRSRAETACVAVYDLGGGTFDVSILKLHDGIFEVLATHGDTALGGDDLDRALVTVFAREIQDRYDFDPLSETVTRAALIEAAEEVKFGIAENSEALFRVDLGVQGTHERRVTREEFDSWVQPVLERTREPCLRALRDAGITPDALTAVVLVGGPTRLGAVRAMARSVFGREPDVSVHPDEVVALGAAIQADILAGNNRELLLLDVVPLSLGLETYGGLSSTLIPRNTRIPTAAREIFTTFADRQTGVDLHVVQGEREKAEENRSLARFTLKGIPPQPAGLPRIEVTFLIDADGILSVSARDLKTGNEQSVEVRPSFGLTDAEVARLLAEGAANADADRAHRQLVEARNEVEPLLRGTRKNLEKAGQLLAPEELDRVRRGLERLEAAVAGDRHEPIQTAARELEAATGKLANAILADALNSARS